MRSFDIEAPRGWSSLEAFHAELLPALAARHRLCMHPLDQSLRHGSQTSRSLLAEREIVISALLAEFQRNRGEVRLVGCWSVRLRRGGYHVNQIHPEG